MKTKEKSITEGSEIMIEIKLERILALNVRILLLSAEGVKKVVRIIHVKRLSAECMANVSRKS